ncbi:hypothetical protein SpCBS45565_g03288 [Spizellomyces sp. 'palustris']|nr:hypothetical protein SpCBS45565_g03288 [Spizellomyces sp. 'palustris']
MKTHELLHLGIKPFTCGIEGCDRAFSQLGNLKSHQAKVHHNPSRPRSGLKRSITPSSEEEDGESLYKRRRRSSSAHSTTSSLNDAVVPSDGSSSDGTPPKPRRIGQTKEQRLLKKMKAVLERRSSGDQMGLQLSFSDIPEEDEQFCF